MASAPGRDPADYGRRHRLLAPHPLRICWHDGHFRFDTVHRDFELEVTIAGDYRDQYDQAGLMVRTDDEHWIKCDIELVDDRELVSAVVTNRPSE